MFREESFVLVVEMLEAEGEPLVLSSGISALGHLRKSASIPVILKHLNHPDHVVRLSAAMALGSFPDDELAISGLLALTGDEDAGVREEAAVGLGKRRDIRLLPVLRGMLDAPDLKLRVAEAASALLGLPEDPAEWKVEDYKDSLNKQFGYDAA